MIIFFLLLHLLLSQLLFFTIQALELLSLEDASTIFYSSEPTTSLLLKWNIHFTDEEQSTWITIPSSSSSSSSSSSKPKIPIYSCFVINTKECACVERNVLIEVETYLPIQCTSRAANPPHFLPRDFHLYSSHLWFHIHLHYGNRSIASTPLRISSLDGRDQKENIPRGGNPYFLETDLTLVLPITLSDASRVLILFTSLKTIQPPHNIRELLVFTPAYQLSIMTDLLTEISKTLSFPVKIYSESKLYYRPISQWRHANYAIQMSIKLLAARLITTAYYLTLDSDVILLHHELLLNAVKAFPLEANHPSAVARNTSKKEGICWKGAFNSDPAHSKWWAASQSLLGVDETQVNINRFTFGVTPAILSTWGSLMVLSLVEKSLLTEELLKEYNISSSCFERENRYFDLRILKIDKSCLNIYETINEMIEKTWLELFNVKFWTEYTLYRISLEYFQVFDSIHFKGNGVCNLHCYDIWLKSHNPWDSIHAFKNKTCAFSVVQSSKGISTNTLYKQYIEGLGAKGKD